MNINPVSFSATSSAFQDLISKPQTYKENPMSASKMDTYNGKPAKKKHILLKVIGAAAVIAGALALGAKGKRDGGASFFTEKLTKMENKESFAYKALDYMNKAGTWLIEQGTKVVNGVKGLFKKGEQAAEGAGEKGEQSVQQAVQQGEQAVEQAAEKGAQAVQEAAAQAVQETAEKGAQVVQEAATQAVQETAEKGAQVVEQATAQAAEQGQKAAKTVVRRARAPKTPKTPKA